MIDKEGHLSKRLKMDTENGHVCVVEAMALCTGGGFLSVTLSEGNEKRIKIKK